MMPEVAVFDEPPLEFRYGQRVPDPRDGLSLFGPCDVDDPSHPHSVSHGIIGPAEGIDAFAAWADGMKRASLPPERRRARSGRR